MKNKAYKVLWSTYARVGLALMKEYKVDPMNVFRRSKAVLTNKPQEKAYVVSLTFLAMNSMVIIGY